jgi:uncharacterized membrane protein
VCCPPSGTLAFVATPRGLDRLVTFADAVVAIAITLLVLPLVDIPGQSRGVPGPDLLRDHFGEIGAFLLSFAVIARFWTAHHRTFEHVRLYDTALVQLTMLWLVTIAFLPFPTELLGRGTSTTSVVLYIGTLLASSLVLTLTVMWLSAHPALLQDDSVAGRLHRPRWATTFFLVLALLAALVKPSAGLWSLLLLLLAAPLDSLIDRRRT